MILFANRAAQHIAQCISLRHGNCTIKSFSDGELFVRINEQITDKKVWVIAATQPPAENLLELFFLLDALQRAGASINLVITYFSYARQIIAAPGEALSAKVISDIFKNFIISQILIMHPHTILLDDFLSFKPIYDLDFFCNQAQAYDAIAAPDKGAVPFAKKVAQTCNKDLIVLTKIRPEHEEVTIVSVDGSVANKKILLIDDMIATGRTLIAAANELKKHEAMTISAAATHGIFSPGSHQLLEQSILEKIYVTNSITRQSQGKITVIDSSPFIQKMMQESNKL